MQPVESKPKKRVSNRAIVFVVVGLPAGLMALLVPEPATGEDLEKNSPLNSRVSG